MKFFILLEKCVFWLVIGCFLVSLAGGFSDIRDECWRVGFGYKCIVCENKTSPFSINCSDNEVIKITDGFYGRKAPGKKYCNHTKIQTTSCLEDRLEKLQNQCDNMTTCEVKANHDTDPCKDTYKYVQLHFCCRRKDWDHHECESFGGEYSIIERFSNFTDVDDNYSDPHTVIKVFSRDDLQSQSKPLLQKLGVHLETIPFEFTSPVVTALTVINTSKSSQEVFIADRNSLLPDPNFSDVFAFEGQPLVSIVVANLGSEFPIQAPVQFSIPVSRTSANEVDAKFKQKAVGRKVRYRRTKWICVFIDPILGQFHRKGCQAVEGSQTPRVTCACNHTTVFGVLLAVDAVILPPYIKELSYTTNGASAAFLLVTIVVLLGTRKIVSSDRTFVQINLSMALLMFYSLSLIHDALVMFPFACKGLSASLHYFLLSSVFWMLMEGVTLAIKTSSKSLQFSTIPPLKLNLARCLFSWGFPAIIVSSASAVAFLSPESYLAPNPLYESGLEAYQFQRCFIDYRSHLIYWSLIGPICLCIAVNLAVLVHVAVFTHRMNAKQPQAARVNTDGDLELGRRINEVAQVAKLLFLLTPVMGITLLLGVFVGIGSTESSWVFMYAHVAINGLQGVFIFVIYCMLSKGVRNAMEKFCSQPQCSYGQ